MRLLCEQRKPFELQFDEPTEWKTFGEFTIPDSLIGSLNHAHGYVASMVQTFGIYQYKRSGWGFGTSVEYRWTEIK